MDAAPGPVRAEPPSIREYGFVRPALLREALTHRSASGGGRGSNERLEFVGDRVLGLIVAEWLAERFPEEQEGGLGPRHALLVSRPVLARVAVSCELPALLSVAPNELRTGVAESPSVLADALEAVIGALYFDGGLDRARDFVRRTWANEMAAQAQPPKDAKTLLQEYALGRRQPLPRYETTAQEGPSHAPVFTVAVSACGGVGTGRAGSKREAERAAAAALLGQLA